MSDAETKCWFVQCKSEDFGDFVFAETRAKAIYQSEAYGDTLDWVAIRAIRVPKLDGKEISKANVEAAGFTWHDNI